MRKRMKGVDLTPVNVPKTIIIFILWYLQIHKFVFFSYEYPRHRGICSNPDVAETNEGSQDA